MKFKKIFQLIAILALPLSFLSCGDEKKVAEESKEVPTDEVSEKDHAQIGKEISTVMDELMTEMSSISDTKSAQAFSVNLAKHKATLKGLVKDAGALAPPTDAEKVAVQAIKDAQDAKGEELLGKLMMLMSESPDAEAIGEVMKDVMDDKEMDEVTEKIEKIYGLKEEGEE
jgi:hypothetical protein